jgi:hypothetical protein
VQLLFAAGAWLLALVAGEAEPARAADWFAPSKTPASARAAAKEPSVWDRMSAGTRRLFSSHKIAHGAKQIMAPKRASSGRKTTTTRETYRAQYTPKSADKPSFWESLFGSDEPPPPRTVNEFLKLKRPDP